MQVQLYAVLFHQPSTRQNFQITMSGWNPYGVIITLEMELADNTYLDGDRKSALKVLEEVDPQTTEPRTIWYIPFLHVLLKFTGPLS